MFKTKGVEKHNGVVVAVAVDGHAAAPTSCIGSGMSIVGNVECRGPTQVFGRIDGELRATELVIGEGAEIEGNILAQEVIVSGRVKGTIRAAYVRLQGGVVEGDIFHRTLTIDENSLLEGMSRRMENSIERTAEPASEASSGTAAKEAHEKIVQSPPLIPSAVPAVNGASVGH